MPKQLRLILKLVISIAALAWAFHDLDLSELGRVGRSAHWLLIFAAAALSVVSIGVLAVRWKEILTPLASTRVSMLLRAHYIGLFGNNAFPLRAGEFMRADFVRRRLDQSFISILGTIFIERSIDLGIVGLLFVALALTLAIPGLPSIDGSVVLGAGLLLLVAGALALHFRSRLADLMRQRFPGAAEARKLLGHLSTGRGLLALALASGVIWLLYFIRVQAVISSIGLPIDPALVALILVATAAGFLIPAAPGALGTYHMAVVFSMHDLYGIQLVDAQAAAILLHLSAYVPTTLIGFVVFLASSHEPEQNMSRSHA